MKVNGKVIVVTGAGSGMGREVTLLLLKRGAKVAAVDLRQPGLDETAALAGNPPGLTLHLCDVGDRAAVKALPDAVIAAHGAVDGLINNAGIIQPFVRVHQLDDDAVDRVIRVNLTGTLQMARAFLPHLLARPEAHLVNVSSMGGFLPVPGQGVYGAAKAAVKLLTEALYAELLETHVKVSVVMPGAIATAITTNSGVSIKAPEGSENSRIRPLPAPDAARIIVDGIEADRLHIYVGNDSWLMSLLVRLAPKFATWFIQRQMKALLDN